MGRKYKNPPVIESFCEFRLTQDTPWDLTIPGLFYEKVKEDFPHREQRVVQEVKFELTPQGVQQQLRTEELTLLYTDNREMLAQIGPRILAVNALKPYPSWARFRPMIDKVFSALKQTTEVRGLQRVGLRYINRLVDAALGNARRVLERFR